jgi:hypothetical protein
MRHLRADGLHVHERARPLKHDSRQDNVLVQHLTIVASNFTHLCVFKQSTEQRQKKHT